ncbi:hypothetical protein PQD17_gp17 [Pantoea phage PdC23]|uniref:Tail fiber protein n=1 Tax=Pantoea phage PdC23 TaxID=2894356 RepID=A0AAE8YHH6_9CAUD|nr:hypothetical protein PQD17_gp17 [Pantoea phage PdC23]UGC97730.1 hypothetical protein pdc_017 [Pantoea phage PdC23]
MTNYAFTGNETKAITFTPTLDGTVYNASVTWNIAAQRWYITITSGDGTRLITRPMVESPADRDINLLFGVFTSTLVWREINGVIEVN